jgi:glutamyl-tRNA reductase
MTATASTSPPAVLEIRRNSVITRWTCAVCNDRFELSNEQPHLVGVGDVCPACMRLARSGEGNVMLAERARVTAREILREAREDYDTLMAQADMLAAAGGVVLDHSQVD